MRSAREVSMARSAVAQCGKAVSLFRGLYARVAHKLGVDVSYISRIAHGHRKSKTAEKALDKEFKRVLLVMGNNSSGVRNRALRPQLGLPPKKRS